METDKLQKYADNLADSRMELLYIKQCKDTSQTASDLVGALFDAFYFAEMPKAVMEITAIIRKFGWRNEKQDLIDRDRRKLKHAVDVNDFWTLRDDNVGIMNLLIDRKWLKNDGREIYSEDAADLLKILEKSIQSNLSTDWEHLGKYLAPQLKGLYHMLKAHPEHRAPKGENNLSPDATNMPDAFKWFKSHHLASDVLGVDLNAYSVPASRTSVNRWHSISTLDGKRKEVPYQTLLDFLECNIPNAEKGAAMDSLHSWSDNADHVA